MKNNNLLFFALLFFFSGILFSCTQTDFYADPQADGLGIFSNTGNNLMSCYIQKEPWRTRDRKTGGFLGSATFELNISKQVTSGPKDNLIFTWYVNPTANNTLNGDISLVLAVPKVFGYKELSALTGQRLALDTLNGYFTFSTPLTNLIKGTGNIYFHEMQIDSIGPNNFTGRMSGLMDAKFGSSSILKNGRFDHNISAPQIQF
ncbi:MAG: hypothetical protein ABI685_08290 [Ferruginibacter sp.]